MSIRKSSVIFHFFTAGGGGSVGCATDSIFWDSLLCGKQLCVTECTRQLFSQRHYPVRRPALHYCGDTCLHSNGLRKCLRAQRQHAGVSVYSNVYQQARAYYIIPLSAWPWHTHLIELHCPAYVHCITKQLEHNISIFYSNGAHAAYPYTCLTLIYVSGITFKFQNHSEIENVSHLQIQSSIHQFHSKPNVNVKPFSRCELTNLNPVIPSSVAGSNYCNEQIIVKLQFALNSCLEQPTHSTVVRR